MILKRIISSLLGVLLTLCIIVVIFYYAISQSISVHDVKSSIQNQLLSGFIYDNNGNKTEIFNTILRLTKLDEETVQKIMENETANRLLTDVVNSIYDYRITGDKSVCYTEEDVISLVNDNMDKILGEINYSISNEDRRYVLDYVSQHTKDILDIVYSTDIGDYRR